MSKSPSSVLNSFSLKHQVDLKEYFSIAALKTLGFASYLQDCEDVLVECKDVALKKRRGSSRLENLGIPEEELLRQQQELFAKVCV